MRQVMRSNSRCSSAILLFLWLAAGTCRAEQEGDEARLLAQIPLVEVTATGNSRELAVMVSGDGGWAALDKAVTAALAQEGIPTVGLNSLKYFWTPRTPDEAGRALAAIVRTYLARWNKERVVLIGYSRGADVLPFMVTRLPPELLERTVLIVLLGVASRIDFEFHVADWIPGSEKSMSSEIQPEAERLAGKKVLCIYGSDDKESLCPKLDPARFEIVETSGGHHFGGDYKALAQRIISALP